MADQKILEVRHLGTQQPYVAVFDLMKKLHEQVAKGEIPNQLLLLEHAPVITITRQHQHRSLLSTVTAINRDGIDVEIADRGGDATFHGPGQLVGYPLIKLGSSPLDAMAHLESYVRGLEDALVLGLKRLGLNSIMTIPGFTGIWRRNNQRLKKLVAIGVGITNGVSKHGFALNISIDAAKFLKHLIPCGLKDRGVATLREAFLEEHLSLPDDFVMLNTLATSIAERFSLTLSWQDTLHRG